MSVDWTKPIQFRNGEGSVRVIGRVDNPAPIVIAYKLCKADKEAATQRCEDGSSWAMQNGPDKWDVINVPVVKFDWSKPMRLKQSKLVVQHVGTYTSDSELLVHVVWEPRNYGLMTYYDKNNGCYFSPASPSHAKDLENY